MAEERLRTLKEVAEQISRPPHRIIHLCEIGVVCPEVDSAGRGSVRRYSREDVFRVLIALRLQEIGVPATFIKDVMSALDALLETHTVRKLRKSIASFDLVEVIKTLGASPTKKPIRAYLLLPSHQVIILVPGQQIHTPNLLVKFCADEKQIEWPDVFVGLNLSAITAAF